MTRTPATPVATLAVLLALAACADTGTGTTTPGTAAPLLTASANRIAGEYVVVLKEGASPRSVSAIAGVDPDFVYSASVNGFSATLNPGQLNALRHHPAVEYVEENQVFSVNTTTQFNPPWGLDRIDQLNLPLNGTYVYDSTAANVTAYVIDSGIRPTHAEFTGRAASVFNSAGGSFDDCNGHGTHVAGTIGAVTYGVAKAVRIRGVKVLNCAGSGSLAGVIAGVDWVRVNATRPAVANLSLGGGFSATLNNAVNNLANARVYVVVSAGNNGANACNYSPASAADATSVGASDRNDQRAPWSNVGPCLHLYAPGVSILSTWWTSNTATAILSGTSMAAPHVAGVGALYLSHNPGATNAAVRAWIVGNATPIVVPPNPASPMLFKSTL